MTEKIKDLKKRFFIHTANQLFLDKDISYDFYTKEYEAYVVGRYPCLGGFAGFQKVLRLDVDGVLNAYQSPKFSHNYFSTLGEINQRVERILDPVIRPLLSTFDSLARRIGLYRFQNKGKFQLDVKRIPDVTSISKVLWNLSKELRESKLKEEEHSEAGRIAVERTQLVTNLYPAFKELEEDMGFTLHLDTYSPDAVAFNLGEKIEIPNGRINPTKFIFNKGQFVDLNPFSEMWKKIDEEERDAVFVTDDWKADAGIAAAIDLGLIVLVPDKNKKGKPEELPAGKIYIQLPEMREDFSELPKVVRMYELARLYTFYLNPASMKKVILLTKEINRDAELCEKLTEKPVIYSYGQTIKQKTEVLLDLLRPVPEESYGMRELLNELSHLEDIEKYKSVIVDIKNSVNETPFPKAKDAFIESLEPYIKELENLKTREVDWLYD